MFTSKKFTIIAITRASEINPSKRHNVGCLTWHVASRCTSVTCTTSSATLSATCFNVLYSVCFITGIKHTQSHSTFVVPRLALQMNVPPATQVVDRGTPSRMDKRVALGCLRRRKTLIPNRGRWSSLSLFRQIRLGEVKLLFQIGADEARLASLGMSISSSSSSSRSRRGP